MRATALLLLWGVAAAAFGQDRGQPWKRHTIDDSSKGADGARPTIVDGRRLLATAWEEGGLVRVCQEPDKARLRDRWPGVTVARRASGEDAVALSLDEDGAVDVVSCHEGKTRSVFVHWGPKDKEKFLDSSAWKTDEFPAVAGKQMWMMCLPVEGGLALGSKGNGASVGLLARPPDNARDVAKWTWIPWYEAGWIMSLVGGDLDGDGDGDVLASDRYGKNAGIVWFENPGKELAARQPWKAHRVAWAKDIGEPRLLRGLDQGNGKWEVVVATPQNIVWLRLDGTVVEKIAIPDWVGRGKAVNVDDIDGDGKADLVLSCENAGKGKSGVVWFKREGGQWVARDISGPVGIKYDLVFPIDLDGDGDLDVVTTEEREGGCGLGVVWYENPSK